MNSHTPRTKPIDLSKCKIGQRVRLRDGSLATFKYLNVANSLYPFVFKNKKGQEMARTKSGFYYHGGSPMSEFDVVKILSPEKPKQAGKKPNTLERLTSAFAATAWRPIDEEPRDGTLVLYYSPSCGQWIGNHPPDCARGEWGPKKQGGWCGHASKYADETHFQPLPEPPTL